jgi:phage portal protein BeeE
MNELISATRAAYYAFNMVRQGQVKALAASFIPVWETNQPQEPAVDFETLAIVGYARNPIVFACIEALAQSSSEAPAKVMQRQDSGVWEEDFTHPLRQLLQFPNQFESGFELVETIITHLYISGNAYLEKERVGGQVVGLHPLMPHKMRVVPGRSFIQGYEYMVGDRNIPLKREDVIHFKLPNQSIATMD